MRDAVGMPFALVSELVEWVEPFFSTFGYLIVSVAMFFESAALTGIVVPGDVILAVGGVYAGQGELQLGGVILAGSFFGLPGRDDGIPARPALRRRMVAARADPRALPGPTDRARERDPSQRREDDRRGPVRDGRSRLDPVHRRLVGRPTANVLRLHRAHDRALGDRGLAVGFFVGNHVETIDKILSRVGWIGLALVLLFVSLWIWRRRRSPKDGTDDRAASKTIDDE